MAENVARFAEHVRAELAKAVVSLLWAAKATAAMDGRDYLIPDDVKAATPSRTDGHRKTSRGLRPGHRPR